MNNKIEKLSDKYSAEKARFHKELSEFAQTLGQHITLKGNWAVKGFIDAFKNVYAIPSDTIFISKILELTVFPFLLDFAHRIGYTIESAAHQNLYPDFTFVNNENSEIKFAVDLKTSPISEKRNTRCAGFMLGLHGEYYTDRDSNKNIQYPYNKYVAHFCLGIIYSSITLPAEIGAKKYSIEDFAKIPSVINRFIFFAVEKWRIASDKCSTKNCYYIASIKKIKDIIAGNGAFAKAGEEIFDDYWANYGKIQVETEDGRQRPMDTIDKYIKYKGLSIDIKNKNYF
ncbi:MAG: EcoRV family type II restriction endonuclease [Oscillospiraceae bacterium]|nr:EcoRV family type II restriction endonuclease [Oscillospiraceae bacterium]